MSLNHIVAVVAGAMIGILIGELAFQIIVNGAIKKWYRRTKTFMYLVRCGVGVKAAYRLVLTYK